MEQSAYEAIMIGVNAFVFIIALTASILLMSNIIDMVDYANEQAIVGMNGSLAESVGVVEERIYSGYDLLTYYREEQQLAEKGQTSNKIYNVMLNEEVGYKKLDEVIKDNSFSSYMDKQFLLRYEGKYGEKFEYTFVVIN